MKKKQLISYPILALAVLALSASASGQGTPITYQKIATIPVPRGLTSFDISWVDPANQRFYLADRTSKKGGGLIDVVDTPANTLLYTFPTTQSQIGFAGSLPAV